MPQDMHQPPPEHSNGHTTEHGTLESFDRWLRGMRDQLPEIDETTEARRFVDEASEWVRTVDRRIRSVCQSAPTGEMAVALENAAAALAELGRLASGVGPAPSGGGDAWQRQAAQNGPNAQDEPARVQPGSAAWRQQLREEREKARREAAEARRAYVEGIRRSVRSTHATVQTNAAKSSTPKQAVPDQEAEPHSRPTRFGIGEWTSDSPTFTRQSGFLSIDFVSPASEPLDFGNVKTAPPEPNTPAEDAEQPAPAQPADAAPRRFRRTDR
jgi:hypothetical protein